MLKLSRMFVNSNPVLPALRIAFVVKDSDDNQGLFIEAVEDAVREIPDFRFPVLLVRNRIAIRKSNYYFECFNISIVKPLPKPVSPPS